MDEKEIRSFLIAQPKPAKILVRTADDEVHEIAKPDGKGNTWSHVSRSVVALEHVYIELQDADGRLLRATKTSGEKSDAPVTTLTAVHSDPETARLTHFANLLADAYKFSTGLAFAKMVEVAQMTSERMQSVETRLERTEANYRREMKERLDEQFDRAEELADEAEAKANAATGDPTTALLQQFAGGLVAGGSGAPPPNGVAKGKA